MSLVYLDFDGVCHHYRVLLQDGRPWCPEGTLFEHAELLLPVIDAYPELKIVLSTSWVRVLRFSTAKAQLPPALQKRVIGATWHSQMRAEAVRDAFFDSPIWSTEHFLSLSRYEQILIDAKRRGVNDWIALDDDDERWPEDQRHHLVYCDPVLGLSAPGVIDELVEKLSHNDPVPRF